MKPPHRSVSLVLAAALAGLPLGCTSSSAGSPAAAGPQAQGDGTPIQVTGTIGSPAATTTISGAQLPAPDPAFGGVIKNSAMESQPWWAPRIVPPKGAPNILLIMTD